VDFYPEWKLRQRISLKSCFFWKTKRKTSTVYFYGRLLLLLWVGSQSLPKILCQFNKMIHNKQLQMQQPIDFVRILN